MDTERFQPAGPWYAFDRWYPPDTRLHKGPTGGEIDDLARADQRLVPWIVWDLLQEGMEIELQAR